MRFVNLVLLLVIGSTCLLLAGCGAVRGAKSDEVSSAEARVRVTPLKTVRKTLTRYCEQPGQIAALEETPIYAKVNGYVHRVLVDIGDKVTGPVYEGEELKTAGQLLLEIEVPELEKELAQKTASIEQARSEIKQAQAAVKVAEAMRDSAQAAVEEADATVERMEADFQRWKSEFARMTDLASRQAVTQKLVEETESKYKAADALRKEVTAKIKSAHAQLGEAEAQITKAAADEEATQSMLAVAQADHDRIQSLLGFAEIRSPFDGVVAARNVDTGHLVNSGSSAKEPLLIIVRPETVRVFVDVPEIDAIHIEPRAEAKIRMPSLAGDGIAGTVTRTSWVLNQATRTLRIEIDVPNETGRLRPGMYAHARIKVAERKEALTLPKSALLVSGGQTSCWRIESDGTLRRTNLQIGIESGGEFEIVSGLSGDEDLIGVNAAAFREGQQVEVVAPKVAGKN